jgi:hypothetical protein
MYAVLELDYYPHDGTPSSEKELGSIDYREFALARNRFFVAAWLNGDT